MKTQTLMTLMKSAKQSAIKHSPEILVGVGIVGMISTVVLAVKATPKAMHMIDDAKTIRSEKGKPEMTKLDILKVSWTPYIPAAITGIVSISCLIGSSSVSARRNAVLATAYGISESAFREYKEKTIETIGEKKEEAIRDKVSKSKIEANPVSQNEVIITEKGNTLCYDAISGRYFRSDIEKIKRAENDLNKSLMSDYYISLNEFYYQLGLKPTKLGDGLGWNLDGGLIDLEYSSQLAEDGTPCLVIDYRIAPRYDYQNLS
ncbi:MAG: DUF6353 family protein [Eubacteriales bacterium]|nr:DUF6353 family protein [Eubacteriales bacterium]